ncbi:hypothetical protein TNCV_5027781 [Trichonephila clavipes]|nr:hypothetical protein TNCV_5027781 [Trichonephila clavipes]
MTPKSSHHQDTSLLLLLMPPYGFLRHIEAYEVHRCKGLVRGNFCTMQVTVQFGSVPPLIFKEDTPRRWSWILPPLFLFHQLFEEELRLDGYLESPYAA